MKEEQVKNWTERFNFQASGMQFDLRLTEVCTEEWGVWRQSLLNLATAVIHEMNRFASRFDVDGQAVFEDTEFTGEEMVFRYCSEVGKVEVLFDFHPRTLEIRYKSMQPTMYEDVYSLF